MNRAQYAGVFENGPVNRYRPMVCSVQGWAVGIGCNLALAADFAVGATAPATGKSLTMDIHHWFRFRDGKIYFYRGTEDTAATAQALRQG